ncbi:MAG: Holliday junction resolvase RuvX [Pseudomonadota bacterium]
MKIRLLKDCHDAVPKNTRLLGLDLGSKMIGLAISNREQTLATPLDTIRRTKFSKDIEKLDALIKEFEVGGYILGWPLNMDGSEGPRCDVTRSFADEMTKHPEIFGQKLFIAYWDERLSTQAVDDYWDKSRDKRGKKEAGITDKLAAQIILQGALDSFKHIE